MAKLISSGHLELGLGPGLDGDAVHLDWNRGIVPLRLGIIDLRHDVRTGQDLSEDGVLGLAARKPVQVGVVAHVDEELGAPRVGSARVGHGERERRVGVFRNVLILDVAAVAAFLDLARGQILESAIRWATLAGVPGLGVFGVGAAKLVHEAWDHAVEVDAVVEPRPGEVDEVRGRAGHPVQEDLGGEDAFRRVEGGDGVLGGGKSSHCSNNEATLVGT
mmetsp:Transcript_62622/g.107498  ORF Transcript_62622/g.107498 Transcript_62622/m.107498 type:complete len:219 (-) Transcript_62622:25-681(-)